MIRRGTVSRLHGHIGETNRGPLLLGILFEHPLLTVDPIRDRMGIGQRTATALIRRFETAGLLEETTGGRRNQRYRYAPYLALFADR